MFVKRFVRIPEKSPKLAGISFYVTLAMSEAVGGATRTDAPKGE
jgi:hypothetical protein